MMSSLEVFMQCKRELAIMYSLGMNQEGDELRSRECSDERATEAPSPHTKT